MSKEKPARAIPNRILAFPQTHINARFLSHIDNFGAPLDERYQKRGQPLKKDIMCGRVLVYVLGRG
jgi:hypothetical protein